MVRLKATVGNGPGLGVRKQGEIPLSATTDGRQSLDVTTESPKSVRASFGSAPRLHMGSDAVAVPLVDDYEALRNKPRIEEVELVGNHDLPDFGMGIVTNQQIIEIFRRT